MADTNQKYSQDFTDNTKYLKSKFMDDAILTKVTSLGVAPGALVSNLARSGQLGTGIRFTKLDGATPAVFNPAVGVVLQVPSMWDRWPKLQEMLRAVMETHAQSITGIDFEYQLESEDVRVGHDGQMMKVPTRTSRSAVNPSATFVEYTGMPIYNLFRTWMYDIQHPDTNASILPAEMLGEGNSSGDVEYRNMPGWYMSAYSMSMLFIQYDPSGLPDRIYDAFIITNMFPLSIGQIGFERQLGQTKKLERNVSFSGLVQHNENTRELGVRVAQMLALHKINYNFALPGLGGEVDPSKAIQKDIRAYGGLEYEAGSTRPGGTTLTGEANKNRTPVDGSIQQYKFLGSGGNEAYQDTLKPDMAKRSFPATGAATANPPSDQNLGNTASGGGTISPNLGTIPGAGTI